MVREIDESPQVVPRPEWRTCPDQLRDYQGFLALLQSRCTVGSLPETDPLNRYTDILPFDDNRCILDGGGYVNASPIALLPGEAACHIAAQGPLDHTRWDVLRLMVQENIHTLVRLTEFVEDGRVKCGKYLPDAGETWREGDLEVSVGPWATRVAVRGLGSCLRERVVYITLGTGDEARHHTLYNLHYQNWPDRGAPDLGLLRCLVQRARALGGRILAHCSAGIGRTGTFFGAMALREAKAQGINIDPVDVILHLRSQRMRCVQTPIQPYVLHAYKEAIEERQDF